MKISKYILYYRDRYDNEDLPRSTPSSEYNRSRAVPRWESSELPYHVYDFSMAESRVASWVADQQRNNNNKPHFSAPVVCPCGCRNEGDHTQQTQTQTQTQTFTATQTTVVQ